MKKSFILFLCVIISASLAFAQRNRSAKSCKLSATEQAAQLSSAMQLSDAVSAKFVPLYIKSCSEIEAVFKKYPIHTAGNSKSLSEKQLKQNNDNRMAIARAIVEIREKYYKKYVKILTANQIDILYRTEKRFRPHPHGGKYSWHFNNIDGIDIPESNFADITIISGEQSSEAKAQAQAQTAQAREQARQARAQARAAREQARKAQHQAREQARQAQKQARAAQRQAREQACEAQKQAREIQKQARTIAAQAQSAARSTSQSCSTTTGSHILQIGSEVYVY